MNTNNIYDYLIFKDPIFNHLIQKYGQIHIKQNSDIFEDVISNIIGQMLSKKIGDRIELRLKEVCEISPKQLSEGEISIFKKCGLSERKAQTIIDFSKAVLNKSINLESFNNKTDEEIIKELTSIKGIGEWTAEMILMFSLGRENIWSFKDIALKNGIMKAKGWKSCSSKRFEALRKKYSPYCSYAAMYFYKVNDDKEF